MISIDDFKNVEMRVGLVIEATDQPGSEKLIKLKVDFGDETRVIFTAVRPYGYTAEYFANKKFIFVTNLEPKVMPYFAPNGATKGKREESQGMILAVDAEDKPMFISAEGLPVGAKVR